MGIGFNPELSGRDNIYLNASVLGLTKKQIDAKFDDIVSFSELKRFIDQKVKNYSSGMQVRLAFSVAIHANRDILLMDEVLAVGDSNFQAKCMEEFNKYKDAGKTVILVTHDIATVQRYCDRAMLLRSGKVVMIGDPEKVGNKYIYQNMSDEEKRLFNEERRLRLKAEKEAEAASVRAGRDLPQPQHDLPQPQHDLPQPQHDLPQPQHDLPQPQRDLPRQAKKIAQITKVEFLDKDGKVKNIFKTGEDLSVRVYFKQNKPAKILNFGIALFTQENNYIFGTNTFIDKIEVAKILKQKYFQINYSKNPLQTNSYYIKAGIFRGTELNTIDFLDRSKIFRIASTSKRQGMIELNFHW